MKHESYEFETSEFWIMVGVLDAIRRKEICLIYILDKSLDYLEQIFQSTNDMRAIDIALLQIKAYLYMGGNYADLSDKFDTVITLAGESAEQILFRYSAKKIRLTRGAVRGLIGRWMPSKENPMKIQDVVDDIIMKVSLRKQGRYLYHYKRREAKIEQADYYELVIEPNSAYFHDIGKMRYYVFDQGEKVYDKDCCIR